MWYGFMSTSLPILFQVGDINQYTCRATRPADFSYKHDAKHTSFFAVARIWDDVDDESILKTLGDVLTHSKAGTPIYPML